MKETEVRIMDEGFEEVIPEGESKGYGKQPAQFEQQVGEAGQRQTGRRPDFRVVQPDRDKDGNVVYLNVGGMWKSVSKQGNEFYTLRIGQLRLLVFPNTNK
jgi:hypothetical protein